MESILSPGNNMDKVLLLLKKYEKESKKALKRTVWTSVPENNLELERNLETKKSSVYDEFGGRFGNCQLFINDIIISISSAYFSPPDKLNITITAYKNW